jgi:hypothetical protein
MVIESGAHTGNIDVAPINLNSKLYTPDTNVVSPNVDGVKTTFLFVIVNVVVPVLSVDV